MKPEFIGNYGWANLRTETDGARLKFDEAATHQALVSTAHGYGDCHSDHGFGLLCGELLIDPGNKQRGSVARDHSLFARVADHFSNYCG